MSTDNPYNSDNNPMSELLQSFLYCPPDCPPNCPPNCPPDPPHCSPDLVDHKEQLNPLNSNPQLATSESSVPAETDKDLESADSLAFPLVSKSPDLEETNEFLKSSEGIAEPRFEIEITDPLGVTTCVPVFEGLMMIGRAHDAELQIKGDPMVDPQQGMLFQEGNQLMLTDLGSRLGMYVRVQGRSIPLNDGDQVYIGNTLVRVRQINQLPDR